MKRIFIIFSLLASSLCTFSLETKKVAILEVVDREAKLSYFQKLMLRTLLSEEVNKAPGFEAYDRTNIDAILGEQNFQRTGLVSEEQIRRLGSMVGASYILVTEGAISSNGSLFVSTNIMDVETGKIAVTANENMTISEEGLQTGCAALAKKLFEKLQKISENYVKEEQRILEKQKEDERTKKSQYHIHRISGNEYTWRGNTLDKKAYAKFLKSNCPEAYKQFNQGKQLIQAGWVFFGIGMATAAGCGIYCYLLENQYKKCQESEYWDEMSENLRDKKIIYPYRNYKTISYSIMAGVGGGLIITSIPLLGTGTAKQKKSVAIYNEKCASSLAVPKSLGITIGQNGLGVAMQF
ncbi:MAG: hypothetical protein IKO26_09875 [Paludibacteraceae bacterium]|nr:hypothetical protein [Paludibacteraceae bacterium]